MLFGVPFSEDSRKAYKTSRLAGYNMDHGVALAAADRVIELIASRASALAGAYGVLLAVMAIFQSSVPDGAAKTGILLAMGVLVAALAVLTPILYLNFPLNLEVFKSPADELDRTYDLITSRSLWFNISIWLAGLSFATGGFIYLFWR